ncbi:helix-turn-helix transcriptional regulator [Clostridium botulinum]|nr:helix-turn-helix transcriptional regulator [Clostridium botulinum]NFI64820.1 helix-turn-helix transcriptional regulator [Clostridium botulinum]NFJ45394.1 helix-turn-helix transcriptional regulator [Clostridium botulinum]NFJ49098.1 helix-turn-helix transcriptional regulator [Clostridium botulinum]NFK26981.1 helix-turn-helix transcriptional regulator [Clostridium botulinum]
MIRLNLDFILRTKNIQQQEISEGTGINKSTINRYCINSFKKIDMGHLEKICEYLDITPNDLIEIKEEQVKTVIKKMSNKYSYFISYEIEELDGSKSLNNAEWEFDTEIISMKQIKNLEKNWCVSLGSKRIRIINFILLDSNNTEY